MSFEEFWPYYAAQHLNPANRRLHFAGTTAGLLWLAALLATRDPRCLLAGLASAYGLAWAGHFIFERNSPATFRHPIHSLRGDFRMYFLMWRGEMRGELERLKPKLSAYRRS